MILPARRLFSKLLPAMLALASAVPCRAQKAGPPPTPKDPPELTDLRAKFALRALSSSGMLADQYDNALAAVEAQAAETGDYETALAAQRRRRDLTMLYSNPALQGADAIVLTPATAKTVGAITLDKANDTLANWRSVGSSATWDIFKLTPGTYTVSITYGVAGAGDTTTITIVNGVATDQATGGEVEFSEVTGLGGNDTGKLVAAIKPTGGWTKFETATLGEIKLTRTSARLMLKATRLKGLGGLMHLKEVRLSPARPAAEPPGREAGEEFDKARKEHLAKIAALEKPIVDAYVAKMEALSKELAAKNDEDGAQLAHAEAERATKAIQDASAPTRAGTPRLISTEGFEEIRNATFVDDPTNTGDHFLVSADGRQFSVRLLWITSPTPTADDKALHKKLAEYFKITPEDSVSVGRLAQDFTAAYLKDKPLRILTRGRKEKGALLATVIPADLGDFAGILIDNGLAMINPPTATTAGLKRAEQTAIDMLRERETAARNRAVPPGAWSFATKPAATP